jgi:beta-lactamase class C
MKPRGIGMKLGITTYFAAGLIVLIVSAPSDAAERDDVRSVVDGAIRPLMAKDDIPGLSVAITIDGKAHVFDYGVASKATGKPVTPSTLFELGSVSKTYTVTLASYAQTMGWLSFADRVAKYLPSMSGKPFGDVVLADLATHTAGGFPLQVPDDVGNDDQLMSFLKGWKPSYEAGTHRTYANPSIGMLGYIAAKSMHEDFDRLMEQKLFPSLGLENTFINLPASKAEDYAQGYTSKGVPARLTPAVLSSEAYGIKTTARDMIHFVEANMGEVKLDPKLQQAITATHAGFFDAGPMIQDLIWEQYPYPVTLDALLAGNSGEMINTMPVSKLTPPMEPRSDMWINKTGSTNGFGAYVAFIPKERIGIVILANKNYPNQDRVAAAYRILTALRGSH